jgi:hypothetical protein
MSQQGIIDTSADDAQIGRDWQRVGIVIAAQRDDRQPLAYIADEPHCLPATDMVCARHPVNVKYTPARLWAPSKPLIYRIE